MMGKLTCDHCGAALMECRCVIADCPKCDGLGTFGALPCETCLGQGEIVCDRGGVDCPYSKCACEAAWERQQEDNASEPPMTAAEEHHRAFDERRALRNGRPN